MSVLTVGRADPDTGVRLDHHRVAVGRAIWEFPAGTLEPGEPPIETAARELTEETGYVAGRIEPLGRFYTSPGFTDELMHVFVARDLVPGVQQLESHEEIEVETRGWADVDAMIRSGELIDGKSVAAVLLWREATFGSGD